MRIETSGCIYVLELDFHKGYAYAETLDYSDISSFDGHLLQVYNLIENTPSNPPIDCIKKSGLLFGPVPVNKYPGVKARNGWKYYGKAENYNLIPPLFKELRALPNDNNWENLKPWYKQDRFEKKVKDLECSYNDVRFLETMILNHINSIKIKITMMKLIFDKESVKEHYDLNSLGNKNLYLQIVNTYYSNEVAVELLKEVSAP